MLQALSQSITENLFGDVVGVLGLLVSIGGFLYTIRQVKRSKSAAEAARQASIETQTEIRMLDIVIDFSSALTMMEEIKDQHRKGQWDGLPNKYSALRQKLISIKFNTPQLEFQETARLQEAIQQFSGLEKKVDSALSKSVPPNFGRFNNIVNDQIDALHEILSQVRKRTEVK